ncbi:hypothetical protein VPH35_051837 [Triticum aestivum]
MGCVLRPGWPAVVPSLSAAQLSYLKADKQGSLVLCSTLKQGPFRRPKMRVDYRPNKRKETLVRPTTYRQFSLHHLQLKFSDNGLLKDDASSVLAYSCTYF